MVRGWVAVAVGSVCAAALVSAGAAEGRVRADREPSRTAAVRAVLEHPTYAAWKQELLAADAASTRNALAAGPELDCGAGAGLYDRALRAHGLRAELLDALAQAGIHPTPAPAGVAPWPWWLPASGAPPTPSTSAPTAAGYDSLDTAVILDDGSILFTNLRGVPEVDPVAASRAFYARHDDRYDFLVLWTRFPSDLFEGRFLAYHLAVANAVEGLGYRNTSRGDFFDDGATFIGPEATGRLQSFVHFNDVQRYPEDSTATYFRTYTNGSFLGHEIGHRWSARLLLWLPLQGPRDVLLGRGGSHWSFFMNTDASVLEGNAWAAFGDRWQTTGATTGYGPLDLYLMGMLHPAEIPAGSLWYLDTIGACEPATDLRGQAFSAISPPQSGVRCNGTRRDFTLDAIYLANGVRRPLYPNTPRAFRVATVLLAAAGTSAQPGEIAKVDRLRRQLGAFFHAATDGRGSLDFTLDAIPARVVFVHRPHGDFETPGVPIPLETTIELVARSLPTTLEDVRVEAHYAIARGDSGRVTLQHQGGGRFTGVLPAAQLDDEVHYWFRATSVREPFVFVWPAGAPRQQFRFRVAPDLTPPRIEHAAVRTHSRFAEPLRLRAVVRDDHGVAAVHAEYRLAASGEGGTLPLPVRGTSDVYEARFDPPGRIGDTVEYRIVATDIAASPHVATSPATGWHALRLERAATEDVEVENPAWTHRSLFQDGPDEWHRERQNHTPGGQWCWKLGPDNINTNPRFGEMQLGQEAVLESPAVRLFPGWSLEFWHRHYFRTAPPEGDGSAMDGGILEWQDADEAAAGADRWFLIDPVGGYPSHLGSYAFRNPLAGYPVFGGTVDFWKQERVDATSTFHDFNGRRIRFRFHVATSDPWPRTSPGAGWYVDDIVIDPGLPPTPIVLEDLDAERVAAGVRLHWRARSAERGDRFRLYRRTAEAADGAPYAPVVEIPARPGDATYTHVDTQASPGTAYVYRLALSSQGREIATRTVSVAARVARFALHRNHPNPFNPATTIRFEIDTRGPTELVIYDVHGRRVRTLIDGIVEVGRGTALWDGRDDAGRAVASGVYVYRLRHGGREAARRMVLVR